MGRHKAIETPELLESLFQQYKKWTKANPYRWHDFVGKDAQEVWKLRERPLTWMGFEGWLAEEGWLHHLGHYEQDTTGTYTDFLPVIRAIKAACQRDIVDGASAGVYQQNIAARIAGLTDKQEQTVKADVNFKDAG